MSGKGRRNLHPGQRHHLLSHPLLCRSQDLKVHRRIHRLCLHRHRHPKDNVFYGRRRLPGVVGKGMVCGCWKRAGAKANCAAPAPGDATVPSTNLRQIDAGSVHTRTCLHARHRDGAGTTMSEGGSGCFGDTFWGAGPNGHQGVARSVRGRGGMAPVSVAGPKGRQESPYGPSHP